MLKKNQDKKVKKITTAVIFIKEITYAGNGGTSTSLETIGELTDGMRAMGANSLMDDMSHKKVWIHE